MPVSFPVPWDDLDGVTPADFTVHTAPGCSATGDPWAELMPEPQTLRADLVEEGHAIPIARVQAMHEGKRRAREREARRPGLTARPASERGQPVPAQRPPRSARPPSPGRSTAG